MQQRSLYSVLLRTAALKVRLLTFSYNSIKKVTRCYIKWLGRLVVKRKIGSPRSSHPPLRENLIKKMPYSEEMPHLAGRWINLIHPVTEKTATHGTFFGTKFLSLCFFEEKGPVNFFFANDTKHVDFWRVVPMFECWMWSF